MLTTLVVLPNYTLPHIYHGVVKQILSDLALCKHAINGIQLYVSLHEWERTRAAIPLKPTRISPKIPQTTDQGPI